MKNTSSTILILLVLATFFMPGCDSKDGKQEAKTTEAIKVGVSDAFINYKFCLKTCDELEKKYREEYEKCVGECPSGMPSDSFIGPNVTWNIAKIRVEAAQLARKQCLDKCWGDFKTHMEEVAQCRQACADSLPGN